MSYENPEQPEGINVSDDHPLRDLFVLLAAVTALALIFILLLSSMAGWLAHYVPFPAERWLAERIGVRQMFDLPNSESRSLDAERQQRQAHVQALGAQLIERAAMDQEMSINIHYHPESTVNAFATLGGHVVIYDGLVVQLPNENSLSLVLAHEIGHIKLRHPLVAMSRGITVSMALGSLLGMTDNSYIGRLVEWIGYSSGLSYSRDQEREADAFAINLLIEHYGHLNGAQGLFEALAAEAAKLGAADPLDSLDFLSTHPGLEERKQNLRERAQALGSTGNPTPLPWSECL